MAHTPVCHHHPLPVQTSENSINRRGLLRTALAGAGLAALGATLGSRTASAAGATDALLLSCMDFRLMDDIVRYMDKRQLTNKYDHVILAGASLGAQTEKYPAWGKTFWDHLDVAIQLHHVHKMIVMDHRDCGAYKVFLGKDFSTDAKAETEIHAKYLRSLEAAIRAKHPKMSVDLLLMDLSGRVEMIA